MIATKLLAKDSLWLGKNQTQAIFVSLHLGFFLQWKIQPTCIGVRYASSNGGFCFMISVSKIA